MAVREFPGLGFDPAPGDPAASSSAAESARSAAAVFDQDAATLAGLDSSAWSGAAADGFRTQLADLPRDLRTARDAHAEAASALSDYAAELAEQQRRAAFLESQAVQLRARQRSAVDAVNAAAGRTARPEVRIWRTSKSSTGRPGRPPTRSATTWKRSSRPPETCTTLTRTPPGARRSGSAAPEAAVQATGMVVAGVVGDEGLDRRPRGSSTSKSTCP